MAVQVEESSFLAYTSEWIKAINRGGLFECTDASYHFFRCMEIEMRTAMKGHVVGSTAADSEIISSVCSSESVLSHWESLASTLREESKMALLKNIIELWLTIRLHAFTKMVLEQFKKEKEISTS